MRTARLNKGVLVAFEGIDGAGKTTQANILLNVARSFGMEVVFEKEPTDGPWGRKIRASAHEGRMNPHDEFDAFMADRREHVRDVIQPAVDRGAIVILDRYYFSTAAYQGVRNGFEPEVVLCENEKFAPRPDVLIVLDLPVSSALARVGLRGTANHFEQHESLEKARAVFRAIRRPFLHELDGTLPVLDLATMIVDLTKNAIRQSVDAMAQGILHDPMISNEHRTEAMLSALGLPPVGAARGRSVRPSRGS